LCLAPSTTVKESLQIGPFLQNKPNSPEAKMNASLYFTKVYSNDTAFRRAKNKPKSTPRRSNFETAPRPTFLLLENAKKNGLLTIHC
jgi:hypothetical protein